MKTETKTLVGQFFHTFEPPGSKKVQYQGYILSEPTPGMFPVEHFSWLDGSPNERKLITIAETTGWNFYPTAEKMKYDFDTLYQRATIGR